MLKLVLISDMPTLYTQRETNIRKTYLLFSFFLIIIIGLGWLFSRLYQNPGILVFAVIFSSLMSLISYWYSDQIVLKMTRAVPVTKESARELYQIMENLCLTAGLPMPKIYLIPEAAPNAFATGRNPQHAVIAVTNGLLQHLNKSELEGVIAHELSHINNRDTLLSTVIVILVGFVSLLSDIFLRSMFWRGFGGRDRRGSHLNLIVLMLGLMLAILAPLAAILIQLAISRKREFLADASGALLTRYPEGLASALEKISRDSTPLSVAQNTTAHLWIDDPFKGRKKTSWFHRLFMTHPPVDERIKALRRTAI